MKFRMNKYLDASKNFQDESVNKLYTSVTFSWNGETSYL